MSHKFEEYADQGYVVLKDVFSSKTIIDVLLEIKSTIKKLSSDIEVSLDKYLIAVSRWDGQSLVTHIAKAKMLTQIQEHLSKLAQEQVTLVESSIICKNKFSNGSIPIHQDISYSNSGPYYDLSAWIPLSNITKNSGGLSVIPKTHKNSIEPAVDFWSLSFTNMLDNDDSFYKNLVTLNLSVGDMVVFDSALQHGSKASLVPDERFAFVTRWQLKSKRGAKYCVPEPIKDKEFGIWNCKNFTELYLSQMPLVSAQDDFLVILDKWLQILNRKTISFIDTKKAVLALELVKILHTASELHDGSDAQGIVYKSLYRDLLAPLKNRIDTISCQDTLWQDFIDS